MKRRSLRARGKHRVNRGPRAFFMYWRPDTVDYVFDEPGRKLAHAAGEQLGRVNAGDTVWVVTVRSGELSLVARLLVDEVTDQAGAEKYYPEGGLWEASYHIIVADKDVEEMRKVSLAEAVRDLRFVSDVNDRLTRRDGHVDPKQLQTMRLLTDESAGMVKKIWEQSKSKPNRKR